MCGLEILSLLSIVYTRVSHHVICHTSYIMSHHSICHIMSYQSHRMLYYSGTSLDLRVRDGARRHPVPLDGREGAARVDGGAGMFRNSGLSPVPFFKAPVRPL